MVAALPCLAASLFRSLPARHNLEKSDRILSLGPLLGPLVAAAVGAMTRGA